MMHMRYFLKEQEYLLVYIIKNQLSKLTFHSFLHSHLICPMLTDWLNPSHYPLTCLHHFFCLSDADRAAGDSLDPLYCYYCWKCHRALLYMEKEAEISNDLLCYTAGNHR